MFATLAALCLVAAQQPAEADRRPTLHQSLELVADRLPYINVNITPSEAKFEKVNLQHARFTFGQDEVMAVRFDALPTGRTRSLVLGWHLPGVKAWGIWSRNGPEEQIEQFEEIGAGSSLFLGMGDPGQFVAGKEYVLWFRVREGTEAVLDLSLSMFSDYQMRATALRGHYEGLVRQVHWDEVDADESEAWEAVVMPASKQPPAAVLQPLPGPEENHLVFDSEAAPDFTWGSFEYQGSRYACFVVNLGNKQLEDNLEMCAFGGDYDGWGYDTRVELPIGIYAWAVKGETSFSSRLEGEPLLAVDVAAARVLAPPKGHKFKATTLVWFKLTGERPPRRVMLFYQDPSWRLRRLVGPLPKLRGRGQG